MDAIDLGLSVKWASCNLGGEKPEDYGEYYAWGELETKSRFDKSNYRGSENDLISKDGTKILAPEADVAHIKLGGAWRMPTMFELRELYDKCNWAWTVMNGISGQLLTSKVEGYTERSIFLPAAGCMDENGLYNVGYAGYLRSSSIYKFNYRYTITQAFNGNIHFMYLVLDRYSGLSVRAVCERID